MARTLNKSLQADLGLTTGFVLGVLLTAAFDFSIIAAVGVAVLFFVVKTLVNYFD